jgi:signal transduction histidine kinase
LNENNENQENVFRIRPAGRHILTIGRDLIKDSYAALVELVKNSYDADASLVTIEFSVIERKTKKGKKEKYLKITVSDDGHGMSFKTVTQKWLVLSTDDKLKRKHSPNGRLMQGRKGIGRYAASLLGDNLFMETVKSKIITSVALNWNEFESNEYLEDVDILVDKKKVNEHNGTSIEITGNEEKIYEWSSKEIGQLIKELRKLISPLRCPAGFSIKLIFSDFPVEDFSNLTIHIEPFQILELFDYRLSGKVIKTNANMAMKKYPSIKSEILRRKDLFENNIEDVIIADFVYEIKIEDNLQPEKIVLLLDHKDILFCGEIEFDFRVYDRDKEAIEALISRGLRDPISKEYLRKTEAKRLLNEINGIAIYRNSFRVRPHGDPGYDWLELDKQRVQNPSRKIGCNQIAGFVNIQSEEESGLMEKAARDGLKEDNHYDSLKMILNIVLSQLEERRYSYRFKTGRGRKRLKVEKELETLFDFESLQNDIERTLEHYSLSEEGIQETKGLILQAGAEKTQILEGLKDIIALYQGQATLGKIAMIVLHEGRKPLTYFGNQIPLINKNAEKLMKQFKKEILMIIVEDLKGLITQEEILARLFDRIAPFATKKRGKRTTFQIKKIIKDIKKTFSEQIKSNEIRFNIDCGDQLKIEGWKEDFYFALGNLAENSIYWIKEAKVKGGVIDVKVSSENSTIIIDFIDNGPGVKKEYIESEIIFEPDFSTKPRNEGTGLGLAIAGEAIQRNNGEIKAIYADFGAYFRIELNKEN